MSESTPGSGWYANGKQWAQTSDTGVPTPVTDQGVGVGTQDYRMLVNGYLPRNLVTRILAGTALHTSTAATDILGTAVGGSKTIAASALNAIGRAVNFEIGGIIGTTGTPNITVEVLLGTIPILTTGVTAMVAVSGPLAWSARGTIQVVTTGATGTVNGFGLFTSSITNIGLTAVSGAAVTLDLTAAQVFKLRVTWGTSSSSNTITAVCGSISIDTSDDV